MFRYKEVQNSICSSEFFTVQTRAVEDYAVQSRSLRLMICYLTFARLPHSPGRPTSVGPGRGPPPGTGARAAGRPVPPTCRCDQQLGVAQKLTVSCRALDSLGHYHDKPVGPRIA